MTNYDDIEQPMAVVQEPVYTEVDPVVAEAVQPIKRRIWPWALIPLALVGAAAFAWPRSQPAPEPPQPAALVQTPDVGLITVDTPTPAPTTPPVTLHCDGHTIEMTLADDGESVAAFLDNSIRVNADLAESASGARYEYAASGLPWGAFGSDWTLELWNKGTDWSVFVDDNALDCGAEAATVTVTG